MELLNKLVEKKRYVLLVLSLIGIFIYYQVINAPFLFDDNLLIEKNVLIRSLKNFFLFFSIDSSEGAFLSSSQFYRPFQYLSYALIYSIFKFNPVPYHLLLIVLHILNSFLVFYLISELRLKRLGAFFAALIFLVHPVQVEAVSYVSGLADPMSFFFVFLALVIFLKVKTSLGNISSRGNANHGYRWIALALFFYICALFSKETSLLFPFLSLLIFVYPDGFKAFRKNKSQVYAVAAVFLISFIYISLRLTVLNFTGQFGATPEANAYTESFALRALTFVNIIWDYFKLLVFPSELYLERPYAAYAYLFAPRTIFGYFVILAGFIASLYSYFKAKKIFCLAFLWVAFSFLPVSGLVPLNAIYLEHWLYYPVVDRKSVV